MGHLHQGHLDLVARARAECQQVVVSIFVNPAQFAPHEDFGSYPRGLEDDLNKLAPLGVDVVFSPGNEDMYPGGGGQLGVGALQTKVIMNNIEGQIDEAVSRPGFFSGVATVCSKLFNIVQPSRAYFGQKDAAQCVVLMQLVRDLNYPLEVVVCDTAREVDGVAMSSRNANLTTEERAAAPLLHHALKNTKRSFYNGETSIEALTQQCHSVMQHDMIEHVDYISFASATTMQQLAGALTPSSPGAPPTVNVSIATKMAGSGTRLIDNILM